MKTEVVLKCMNPTMTLKRELFNENRSCIEIEKIKERTKPITGLMKTEVVLKLL